MARIDLGTLKEQALAAVGKGSWARAAELYVLIARVEPGADWRQRAGEALRKAGDAAGAVGHFAAAAELYAEEGFLLKAIAVCKVVLQLDAQHTATQSRLAELYALRDRGTAPAAAQAPTTASGPAIARTPSEARAARETAATATGSAATATGSAATATGSAPARRPTTAAAGGALERLDDLDGDLLGACALPPGAPMEVLPLRLVLGGRRDEKFEAVAPGSPEGVAVYEIELGAAELARPAPAAAPPSPKGELDFSGLADDDAPPPAPPSPALPLPRIPLFSSLAPDRLRRVIERVALRAFEPGDAIVRQGARGGSLFVIVRGRAQVVLEGPPARTIAHLSDGEFFGELALVTDAPRSATVAAEEPTELLEISRELISEIVADAPEVLKTLLRFFRDRMLERLVKTSTLFAALAPDDALALAGRFKFLELSPGMRLIREGERAPGLFLLLCGDASVLRAGRPIARVAPGDVFGEMSLLDRGPARATVETIGQCWALELAREDFQEIILTHPQVLEYVSELAARRAAHLAADDRVDVL